MVSFKNLFNKDEISVMSSRAFRKKKTPLKDSQKDRELQKLIQ